MKSRYIVPVLIGAGIGIALYSCGGGIPDKAKAVTNFDSKNISENGMKSLDWITNGKEI